MPPDFPLLLVVPALAIDLLMHRVRGRGLTGCSRSWRRSCSSSSFLAVQWPFADFLMSPWARNWFFVSHRMDYGVDPACRRAGTG